MTWLVAGTVGVLLAGVSVVVSRLWARRRADTVIDGLIAHASARQRFTGFDDQLRQRRARQRSRAERKRRDAAREVTRPTPLEDV